MPTNPLPQNHGEPISAEVSELNPRNPCIRNSQHECSLASGSTVVLGSDLGPKCTGPTALLLPVDPLFRLLRNPPVSSLKNWERGKLHIEYI